MWLVMTVLDCTVLQRKNKSFKPTIDFSLASIDDRRQ